MAGMKRRILGILLAALAAPCALANPTGGVVTSGSATIQQNGNTLQITTSTPSTSINWQNFSIGTGETTNITQPTTSSVTLNHVTTQSTSQIFGSLTSNGQVFLINPNGVVFGAGAQVNTAALNVTAGSVSFGSPISFNDTTMTVTGQGFSGGPVTLNTTVILGHGSMEITGSTNFALTGATTGGGSGSVAVFNGVTTTTSGITIGSGSSSGGITATGGTPPTGTAAAGQAVSAVVGASAPTVAPVAAPAGAKIVLLKQEPVY
jgi:filamentous hemagglutinin family protein